MLTIFPKDFTVLVNFGISTGDLKRQVTNSSAFFTPERLKSLRLAISSRARVNPSRVIIGAPLPDVNTLNITIAPRRGNQDGQKRQAGVAQSVEISTADAAQKLLLPIDSSQNTGLSSSLAENGIGTLMAYEIFSLFSPLTLLISIIILLTYFNF